MKKILTCILFIGFGLAVSAQTTTNTGGARAAGMANAGLTNQDVWAVFNNPAAYSWMNNKAAGLFYENRFLMKETGYIISAYDEADISS